MMYPAMLSTSDKTIRKALITELSHKYGHDHKTSIVSEFSLTNTGTRADVAVINGILHGYELKGDLDTLSRLPRQIEGYNSVFDKITIVVGKKHLVHTIQAIPDWWGIILAKDISNGNEPLLIELRKPSQNIFQNIKTVVRLLWKIEIVEILKKEEIYNNLANSTKDELINVLTTNLDANTVKDHVRSYLINRVQS